MRFSSRTWSQSKSVLWLLCGLTALSVAGEAGRRVRDDADPTAEFNQSVDRLRQIDSVEPSIHLYTPAIEAMLKHVYLADIPATAGEEQVAIVLNPNAKSSTTRPNHPLTATPRGLELQAGELKRVISSMLRTAAKAVYASGARRTPMGRSIGYVKLEVGSRVQTLVDVPVGSGRAGVSQRAATIRARMNALRSADPLWWTRLSVGRKNNETVVATPAAPDGFIITADAKFARLRNCTPEQLAQDLIAGIRATYDPTPKTLTARGVGATTRDLDQARRDAGQAWEAGNEAYTRGDLATAERKYRKAIDLQPDYVVAYESLGGVYAAEKKTDQAREQFRKALACSNIDTEQRAEIQAMLDRLK